MSGAAWLQYEQGVSLGADDDGEARVHTDEVGNTWILGWQAERESGEMMRASDYDGALSPVQTEALRQLLNERARPTANVGDWFTVAIDDADDAPVRAGDRCQYVGLDDSDSAEEQKTGGIFLMERDGRRWALQWVNVRPVGGAS